MNKINRRNFIKKTSLSGAAIATASSLSSSKPKLRNKTSQYMGGFAAPKLSKVKVAFIGVGARGTGHAKQFASIEGTEVIAICDLYKDLAQRSKKLCEDADNQRHRNIKLYYGGEDNWIKMIKETKPDAVFISTNWDNHAPMVIKSMELGSHAFVEVPMATNLKDLWDIIDTSEKTRKHCMMMENVNYGRDELMFLNMCRKGYIGDFLHAEAAYIHELRFQMDEQDMNLSRGDDNFKSLVSYSTPAMGRKLYAEKKYSSDHKWNKLDYNNGDLNTSIIKTTYGKTIMVQWDETSPRPYSRHNLIQGTKGILAGFPTRVALDGGVEGITKNHHSWAQGDDLEKLYEKYDHPLYKRIGEEARRMGGHGGMDFIMRFRIVECLLQGTPLDQNVYEGCFWSAVTPLSADSINSDGAPQIFPDFTRGNWVDTLGLKVIS